MSKKNKIKLITGITLALTLLTFTAAFAKYESYHVSLPSFKRDILCRSATKTTGDDYVLNKVTKVGGQFDAADFWVMKLNGPSRISQNYACYEGQGAYTIWFNSNQNANTSIGLYAQNHDLTYQFVNLEGSADLR